MARHRDLGATPPPCLLKPARMRCARSLLSPWRVRQRRRRLRRSLPHLIKHRMRQWRCIAAPYAVSKAPCSAYWTLRRGGGAKRSWKKRRGWKRLAGLPAALRMISTICWPPWERRRKPRWHEGRMAQQLRICARFWIVPGAARGWCASFWPLPVGKPCNRAWLPWIARWMAWRRCSHGYWVGAFRSRLILNAQAPARAWTQAILTRR